MKNVHRTPMNTNNQSLMMKTRSPIAIVIGFVYLLVSTEIGYNNSTDFSLSLTLLTQVSSLAFQNQTNSTNKRNPNQKFIFVKHREIFSSFSSRNTCVYIYILLKIKTKKRNIIINEIK